jgi:hypothetical protein
MGGGRYIKRVKTMATPTSKKNVPRDPVLNKKMKRVKLNKDIIIKSELFNRQQITSDRGNTENITKMNGLRCTGKKGCLANMGDVHT